MLVVLLLLTLADAPEDPAARLADAQASLDALRLEEAVAKLEVIIADATTSDAVRAQAWLALGLARASLLDDDGARVAFAAAITIDGTLAPPADSSPKVKRLFEKTRARLPAGGTLAVPPDPARATTTTTSTTSATSATSATSGNVQANAGDGASAAANHGAYFATTVVGGALLVGAVGATVGAFVADDAVGRPVAGRTRADLDTLRALGVASVVGAVVLGAGSAVALAIGLEGMSQ